MSWGLIWKYSNCFVRNFIYLDFHVLSWLGFRKILTALFRKVGFLNIFWPLFFKYILTVILQIYFDRYFQIYSSFVNHPHPKLSIETNSSRAPTSKKSPKILQNSHEYPIYSRFVSSPTPVLISKNSSIEFDGWILSAWINWFQLLSFQKKVFSFPLLIHWFSRKSINNLQISDLSK